VVQVAIRQLPEGCACVRSDQLEVGSGQLDGMAAAMVKDDAPYHAHIYYSAEERAAAEALRHQLAGNSNIAFAGRLTDDAVGPHPIAQFEVHFRAAALSTVLPILEASGLRALVHPLTDDDLADHTSLARWIGEPFALDTSVLDPPGMNQGVARFGKSDF
jgi:aromatic ring-cleaving dioxygenase